MVIFRFYFKLFVKLKYRVKFLSSSSNLKFARWRYFEYVVSFIQELSKQIENVEEEKQKLSREAEETQTQLRVEINRISQVNLSAS